MRRHPEQSYQLILLPLVLASALITSIAGCGDADPSRLKISGEITYGGEPVPYGDIVFTPDGSQKNSGPQGFATIVDGKYDSSATKGKGFAGGPTVMQIAGFSGPNGEGLLFETEIKADLPRENSVHNIAIPKNKKSDQEVKF